MTALIITFFAGIYELVSTEKLRDEMIYRSLSRMVSLSENEFTSAEPALVPLSH
jgi:hypothetical protein